MGDLNNFTRKINTPGNSINDLAQDTIMYRSINETLAQLKRASNSVTAFTANLKDVSEKLNDKNNVAGVMLNDPEAASAIKATLQNLESGSHKLDEDLEALQHNFLLRGFFRKRAKNAKDTAQ